MLFFLKGSGGKGSRQNGTLGWADTARFKGAAMSEAFEKWWKGFKWNLGERRRQYAEGIARTAYLAATERLVQEVAKIRAKTGNTMKAQEWVNSYAEAYKEATGRVLAIGEKAHLKTAFIAGYAISTERLVQEVADLNEHQEYMDNKHEGLVDELKEC